MATPWGLMCLLIGLSIVEICNTHPMEQLLSGNEGPNGQIMGALVAVMVSVCIVFTLLACVCCKRRSGFKVFRNSPVSASVINETSLSGEDPGHVNPIANAEFTIFTPLSPPHHNNNVFRSQPPVIYTENEINPELNKVINPQIDGIDVSEWFAETEYNFPRNCLKYTRELGTGWFGRVVEGEALSISTPNTWTPVAVRILESSASAHEQAQFLLEAAAYRAGAHPNLLQLMGRSLEATPLLLIQELCPKGDLKKFLVENRTLRESDAMTGVPLRYCTQLAAAVQWLHEHNLPHLDLAARTCQISSDLSLKLGDYGLAVSQYPNDYYQGTPSIPVRWCAPESVNHTNTTLQPKQITLEANIWSLAVTFWEICEWGRMPYDWLTDDEVISQVMDAPNVRLPEPSFIAYYIPPLYRLMEYCWLPSSDRPQINQIYSMLIHLSKTYTSSPTTSRATADFSTENFDLRWESFKPNTIIKTDNKMKSASLTNLHGSFENLADDTVIQMDSWLENVATHTGDMQYVRGLSEAIHELDTALASEQTSSSSSFEPTPLSSLGAARSENILHMDDSSNLDSLIFPKRSESGSETEDETWKRRIERGAYSEKVRQKSKSVADLMVLTHIDMNTVKDIFQEELKKLQEERRESLLFVPVQSSEKGIEISDEKIDSTSNQTSLEIDKTKPSLQDSKLEEEENSRNFDTFLQTSTIESNIILTAVDTVNQNILNSDVVPKITFTEYNDNQEKENTEKTTEHIEIITTSKENYPLVQDFINNERRCEILTHNSLPKELETSVIQSENTNLEPAPTENIQKELTESKLELNKTTDIVANFDNTDRENIVLQLNEIMHQAENSALLRQSQEDNEIQNIKKSAEVLEQDIQVLKIEDKENVSSQAEEILRDADKSVAFLEQFQTISKQEIVPQYSNNNSEQVDRVLEKPLEILDQPHVVVEDKKEETVTPQNIFTRQTEDIIDKDTEKSTATVKQVLNIEDKENISSQVEEILQVAEKSIEFLEQYQINCKEEVTPKHTEDITEKVDSILNSAEKSVGFLEESQIEVEDIKIENIAPREISTQQNENICCTKEIINDNKAVQLAEKSVIILDHPQITSKDTKKEENIVEEIKPQENFSNEEKEVIVNQINEILQEAENSVNNKLQLVDDSPDVTEIENRNIENHKNNEGILKITNDFLLNEQQNHIEKLSINQSDSDAELKINDIKLIETEITPIEEIKIVEILPQKEIVNVEMEAISDKPTNLLNNESESNKLIDKEEVTSVEELKKVEKLQQKEISNVKLEETIPDKPIEMLSNETNLVDIPPPIEFFEEIKQHSQYTEMIQDKVVPIETSNILLEFEEAAISNQEERSVKDEINQEKNVPIETTNISLQSEEAPISKQEENQLLMEEKISLTDIKNTIKTQENIVPVDILLQFEDSATEPIEIKSERKTELTENIESPSELENYLNSDLYQDSTVMPDLIETINSSPLEEISVKNSEYSTIQDFINNERNNNQEDLLPKPQIESKEKTESNIPPVDITADLLSSNVQQINQVFNVFSVTVDHKPPLECFSPVKNYLHPFDQNNLMTNINSLLESEKKYESKVPFVNGVSCANKFIDILDNSQPKKLAQIALDSLKDNIDNYEMKEEKITNGHDEKVPKKLSELALESFKTNSLSEDSGFASVQCEDKIPNGVKDSEDTSEDILKISVDSLEDILSNSDENECEEEIENARSPDELVTSFVEDEETYEPKKLTELVQESLNKTYDVNKEIPNLPDLILDNIQNGDILINVIDSPVKSSSEKDESAIESDKNSPQKLSEIILDSLPCNSPVTSESTDNVSEKTVIDVKVSENGDNSDICEEEISFPTSTPFKPKKENDNFFSFVSEGDEPSDCRVILGPCEDYGLGLYSGLKTTFEKYSDDDRPEEELLQFSSNFMPFTEPENSVAYSLETWDKFLGKSLQDQDNCPSSVFDISPRRDSLDVFKKEEKEENLDKTVTIKKDDATFTIENDAPLSLEIENKEVSQAETTQSSWEPGEGWFLHPQPEADDLTGQIDISNAEIDNSYVGFALDEECENALRNELAAKLPHAQGISHDEPQEPEDWETEERSEIIVKYNVYATPLSPIPEESCCDDVYCDQIQHRDGSDSDSDWSEPGLGHTSQLEDILIVDTETHTALILESPSLREPQHRHTPSQDSCCSNDTLFNLEDLNYGLSPQHHGTLTTTQSQDSDHILEIEITEDTPRQSPKHAENSDSTEMNLTYTKPDININESEDSNQEVVMDSQTETESKAEDKKTKLELKLDPNAIGVAPLPSPEDIPWRQLPASLLTYDEVTQNDKFGQEETTETVEENNLPEEMTNDDLSDSRECTIEADLYSNLTDIRFSGPCDAQLMSTSFSEDAEERDWDSGSDTRSSSSGEFIWKEGEHEESLRALHAANDVGVLEEINPMDAIDEENSRSNSSDDSDDCEDEIEETEFVPSAWDAQATPTKSALRSPEKSNKRKNQQKGVSFKKQKYHCVYEYPREPESPVAPPSDLWRPLSDLSNFADWELDPESCIAPAYDDPDGGYDVLDKFITRSGFPLASGSSRHRDLYQLNPFPEFATGITVPDEDFFISSSARPFQSVGQSSQFFPGQNTPKSKFLWQDYQSSSQQSSRDLSEGITPDSGIDDITPASISDVEMIPRQQVVPPLKCLAAIAADKTRKIEEKSSDSLGGLRHTRNRLKLDLPPSPNSFSSTRTFSIDIINDPVVNREIPTFSTFGKTRFSVQHVATPTDDVSDPLQPGKSSKNVSFEALPHKPMKLTEKVYIMDNKTEETHKPVEMVQGEASLLDSADEDSGIESSANATLERHQQQILN